MKRNGSAVFLMELLMVILFFSLSTVVTLRLFVSAHQQEETSRQLSSALEKAQDTAELFHARGSDLFVTSSWTSMDAGDLYQNTDGQYLITVAVKSDASPAGLMESADISVQLNDQSAVLCRLSVSRYTPSEQEVPT